jgi:hypothetical protein
MHRDHSPLRQLFALACVPLLLLGCTEREEQPAVNEPVAAPAHEPEAPAALPQAPLDREELIRAALMAATAAALGQDDAEAQSQLKGRRFELSMRFGCPGSDAKAARGWTYDQAEGVLRARVQADVDAGKLQASGLPGGEYEGAVGFTIPHPWMLTAGCPNPKFAMGGPAISVVQLFTESDSRVQRPELSHEAVTPMKTEDVPVQGLSLVISGRLEPLADGRAVHCSATSGAPACIVSTLIDRVAIRDPAREGVVLGEWGAG